MTVPLFQYLLHINSYVERCGVPKLVHGARWITAWHTVTNGVRDLSRTFCLLLPCVHYTKARILCWHNLMNCHLKRMWVGCNILAEAPWSQFTRARWNIFITPSSKSGVVQSAAVNPSVLSLRSGSHRLFHTRFIFRFRGFMHNGVIHSIVNTFFAVLAFF